MYERGQAVYNGFSEQSCALPLPRVTDLPWADIEVVRFLWIICGKWKRPVFTGYDPVGPQ